MSYLPSELDEPNELTEDDLNRKSTEIKYVDPSTAQKNWQRKNKPVFNKALIIYAVARLSILIGLAFWFVTTDVLGNS